MKRFVVYLKDFETGALCAIDAIDAPAGYTAEDYVDDCAVNGVYWTEGEIVLREVML